MVQDLPLNLLPDRTFFADLDGDSDLDIYVQNSNSQNRVWINDGLANFTAQDIAGDIGSTFSYGAGGAAFGDVDNDGDIDIYSTRRNAQTKLWINDGTAHFTLKTIAGDSTFAYRDAQMGDVNGDGRIDIYTANELGQNKLWINTTLPAYITRPTS
jgi:FG-GAP-like repeat